MKLHSLTNLVSYKNSHIKKVEFKTIVRQNVYISGANENPDQFDDKSGHVARENVEISGG